MYITLLAINLATIFLSLTLLFFHRHKIINVLFLSFSLISISIVVIVRSIIFFDNPDWLVALVFNNFSLIYYLIGPFFYLHIRSYLTENYGLKKIDFLHFVPAFLHLVNILPYLFTSFAHKIEVARSIQENILAIQSVEVNMIFSFPISNLFPPIIILGYGFYCIYLMTNSYTTGQENNLKRFKFSNIPFGWLIYICVIIIFIIGINLFVSYNLAFSSNQLEVKPFALFQSIFLISIPISLILTPQVLYGFPLQKILEVKEKSVNIISPVQGYEKLSERIHEMMKKDKPFLSSDFSLDELVSLLNVPKHHVYHCLKETMKIKFTDLRSQYRVEHAKELLVDLSKKNITIEAIGLESGFPTRSSFYRAFKLETGITPTEFVARELL
jgi:AraC-like DNA-binding protein